MANIVVVVVVEVAVVVVVVVVEGVSTAGSGAKCPVGGSHARAA